jgi:hypothetical protein
MSEQAFKNREDDSSRADDIAGAFVGFQKYLYAAHGD